jgi:hypothetical protein
LKFRQIILMVGSVIALAACGGGGGDATPAAQPTAVGFALVGTLDGVTIPSAAALVSGRTATVSIKSGQELKLTSNAAVNWSSTLNGASLSVKSITSSVWDNVISAPAGTTTVTLVAAAVADTSKVATLTVVVAPQEFTRTATKLGDVRTYALSDTQINGTVTSGIVTETVSAIASDGSYTRTSVYNNTPYVSTQTRTAEGYRTSSFFNAPGNSLCTYTPAYRFYEFPLFVGKTYTSNTLYSCGTASTYSANRSLSGKVTSYEKVTTPAGTFDALKVLINISFTNATDIPGGNLSESFTCFVDSQSGVELKCDYAYTYPSLVGVPTNYSNFGTTLLTSKN